MLTNECICVTISSVNTKMNKNKLRFLSISLISLFIGASIYVLFRKDTYIAKLINGYIKTPSITCQSPIIYILTCHITDALWGFALTFSLSIIFSPILSALMAFLYGLLWELCQKYNIISGTYDIIDILMYLLASFSASTIIYKSNKKGDKKMKAIKKIIIALSVISVLLAFGLMAISSSSAEDDGDQGEQETENAVNNDNETLGNYSVTIDSCRLAEDWEGNPIAIIKYTFTNNDDDPASFMVAFTDNAYQNGIGLNSCYLVDESANYSSDNSSKQIKQGASIEVESAFELNDNTTDIEVEVQELFSFNEKVLRKTFKITE